MSVLAHETLITRILSAVETARASLERVSLSIPQLLARFAIAGVFFRSGLTKTANWGLTVQLFAEEYRVPILPADIAALFATSFELGCSVLIALGLATRLAALPLLAMTAVIQIFVYPQSWPEHLTWAALLLLLVLRGAGTYSLDHLLGAAFRRLGWHHA
jgi:putative oxidoreductase